ncbi:MAG: UDP-N-acetylmuramyl-tripeptide synthetase, partial [Clostridia bacterium]|nr:UDP-N-acetylmuramyl-tripeptide synthetase [Clostridia bacterium]
ASSHALRLDKLAPLHFAASAFTNFSAEHLDFHCDLSNYLLSKCKIFSMSDKVYVNADDSVCRSSVGVFSAPTVTFGVKNESCDYVAKDIESHGIDGISYTLRSKDAAFRISSHIPGAFTVYNTLAAACMSYEEGISPSVIGEAIKNVSCVEGRLEKIKLGQQCGDISVFIDYAHTEKAMENLLLSVIQFKGAGQRIVTLFGCGGDRDKAKRAPMGRVASLYSDFVIITEDNSRSEDPEKIIYDIMKGIDQTKPHIIIKNRKKAIEYAIKTALPGDIILLVGKGHEQYEITKEGKVPFSEKDIVFECLQEKNGGNK